MKFIARIKVYLDRARVYMNYVQSVMVLVVFVKTIVPNPSYLQYAAMISIFTLAFILIGYFDVKLGVFKHEQRTIAKEHPVLMEMYDMLHSLGRKHNEPPAKRKP